MKPKLSGWGVLLAGVIILAVLWRESARARSNGLRADSLVAVLDTTRRVGDSW